MGTCSTCCGNKLEENGEADLSGKTNNNFKKRNPEKGEILDEEDAAIVL
jgi:hypothetical protein